MEELLPPPPHQETTKFVEAAWVPPNPSRPVSTLTPAAETPTSNRSDAHEKILDAQTINAEGHLYTTGGFY